MALQYEASKEIIPGRERPNLLYLNMVRRRDTENRLFFEVFASQKNCPTQIEVGDVVYPEKFEDARDAHKFFDPILNADSFMAEVEEKNRESRRMFRRKKSLNSIHF